MSRAYYNEHDPFSAAWLRELIKAGHIAPGEVDERDIQDVTGDDLNGFDQCHFFAGVGGWSRALRLAGLSDDAPIWTGSCPCQPFSVAGRQRGEEDERHLWPEFRRLIAECRPTAVFGEQTAGAIAVEWLDSVFDDLETQGYACAAAVLPACAAGAIHERERIWWFANARSHGWEGRKHYDGVLGRQAEAHAISGYEAPRSRRELETYLNRLRDPDGLSVSLERRRIHGYGNAIFPPLAAAFIQASLEALTETSQ